MPVPLEAAAKPLAAQVWRSSVVAVAVAVAVAWALGGPSAGLGVGAVGGAVALWSRGTWWSSLQAFDALAEAARRGGGAVSEQVEDGLVGPAAGVGRAMGALRERLDLSEAAARRALDRIDSVLESTPTGVALLDAEGRIERTNAQLLELLEVSIPPEGMRPVEVLRAPDVLEVIDSAMRGEVTSERVFATGTRDLAASAHPMRGGVLLLVRDVTRARMAERARTGFVANVSHELRTPIAAILGYAENLLEEGEGLPADVRKQVEVIDRHGRRLHQLFEDLLTLHKLEARRRPFPTEPLRLDLLVPDSCALDADEAMRKGLSFSVEVPDGIEAWGNPQAVSAILGNLVGNAIKYTPSGGAVAVCAVVDEAEVRLEVRDTGPGIPEAFQPRVFERFFRVDEGRSRELGGTGLGLAIVKHLAEAMGSRVSVTSVVDKGSTFALHLGRTSGRREARRWEETLEATP